MVGSDAKLRLVAAALVVAIASGCGARTSPNGNPGSSSAEASAGSAGTTAGISGPAGGVGLPAGIGSVGSGGVSGSGSAGVVAGTVVAGEWSPPGPLRCDDLYCTESLNIVVITLDPCCVEDGTDDTGATVAACGVGMGAQGCMQLNQVGVENGQCPDESFNAMGFLAIDATGCCKPTGECGLSIGIASSIGCMARDSAGLRMFGGVFESMTCTPSDASVQPCEKKAESECFPEDGCLWDGVLCRTQCHNPYRDRCGADQACSLVEYGRCGLDEFCVPRDELIVECQTVAPLCGDGPELALCLEFHGSDCSACDVCHDQPALFCAFSPAGDLYVVGGEFMGQVLLLDPGWTGSGSYFGDSTLTVEQEDLCDELGLFPMPDVCESQPRSCSLTDFCPGEDAICCHGLCVYDDCLTQ